MCGLCGHDIDPELEWPHPDSFSLDHIIALADGGELLARDNVRAAHLRCNTTAGATVGARRSRVKLSA